MRVAYLCHRIPYPPDKGDKIRAFHQLRAIGRRHEVDLFTLADDPADLPHKDALRQHCRNVSVAEIHPRLARLRALPYLLTKTALTLPYFYSSRLHREFQEALASRSYGCIFVYCSAMAQYAAGSHGVPVITDFVDVDSDKWAQYSAHSRLPMSAVYRREAVCLRRYEKMVCESSASTLVTTGREASLLRAISSEANVHVVPNGVDTAYFSPEAPGFETRSATPAPAVAFTGDMSYFPNAEAVKYFATQVLPLVRAPFPDVRFFIIGRNPSPDVQALGQIPGVVVTGAVPDIRVYLAEANVFAAPLSIAAGIQNKTLEAMAFGLPVVGTPRAVQGLCPEVAAMADVGTTPAGFADKVIGLLREPAAAREKGQESRRRVIAHYGWEHPLNHLLDLLENPYSQQLSTVAPASYCS